MAVAGTLYLTGTLTGGTTGPRPLALSWSITGGKEPVTVDLAMGDNTLTVPTGTTLILIVPPTSNAVALKVKGAAGDTGVLISKTKPTVLTWDSGPVIVNAASAIIGATVTFI